MADEVQGVEKYTEDFEKAKELATKAHGDQKYGGYPYTYHLSKVEQALRRFGYDPDEATSEEDRSLYWDLITAAWLHDIIEDTHVTRDEIAREFNHRVSSLVWAVTNPQGGNRAWRASKVYPKIINTPYALVLKLADRIANVESCVENQSGLIQMYLKEWDGFESKYRVRGTYDKMWRHLERTLRDNKHLARKRRSKSGKRKRSRRGQRVY
jgi:(p)ppGpp synthase/HD superfamily hydrolase